MLPFGDGVLDGGPVRSARSGPASQTEQTGRETSRWGASVHADAEERQGVRLRGAHAFGEFEAESKSCGFR